MIIEMKKFGTILISRPSGKEAWLAMQPHLKSIATDEEITLDFTGVSVLAPSWMDEFWGPLQKRFSRVAVQGTDSQAVKETLVFLKKINQ